MNTIDLWRKDRLTLYTGPSCWSELSTAQSVALMRFRGQVQQTPESKFAVLKLLYQFSFPAQRWLFDDNFLRRQGLNEEDRELTLKIGQVLLDTLRWIGQDDEAASFPLRFRRFDCHYGTPRIWLRRLGSPTRYYGPAAALNNCTFAEFMFADLAFQKRDWAKLAAILYRPAAPRALPDDRRRPFDRHQVEARARLFADLEPALLERIAFGYACTLVKLRTYFPLVFQPAEKTSSTTQKPGSWLDVAINMVKLDATRVTEIEKLNLYLALKVLNEQIRQGEEMAEQIDNMNKK